MAHVSRLFIYPIKALDRVEVDRVTVLKSGALKHDREFALFDASGHFVNGKRHDRVHALRSRFDLETRCVIVSAPSFAQAATFQIDREQDALATWMGEYFGFPVQIRQNLEQGFPDDTDSPGPTLISTATLATIANWYPNLEETEVRLRFRANIEIGDVPAFWEDQLFAAVNQTVAFQIGAVRFLGINPCQRCVVVTRNSQTGEADPSFQKIFAARRRETLPPWVDRSRFNHFYRLAINTRLPESEAGKTIALGDEIKIQLC
ncbi:MOSC domain-containing protein [Leptolyngbya sp. 'hensonii']|uniref:MOSC domain-containing protein n=1 Tax=Leptolyngbya sp. 'hensonii' TaxID=1922337 RepID=UPI00094FD9BF|nr:MOSC N-terminal beta barrel domain-containing protein [Leptolyngbya sp. 'hensonii']OLP17007.1 MOSC domain-containing protein [Leptolyngbya sp. 'hensonii']